MNYRGLITHFEEFVARHEKYICGKCCKKQSCIRLGFSEAKQRFTIEANDTARF